MISRKLIIIAIILLVAAGLGLVLLLFKKSQPPPPPPALPPTAEIPPYTPPDLNEDEIVALTGKIVVESVGTFDTEDYQFRNLRSVESYVTEDLGRKLEEIIRRGVAPDHEPFERRTKVVAEKFVSKTDSSATVVYSVEVWQSNRPQTSTEVVTVELEKILGRWYVAGTSQIQ